MEIRLKNWVRNNQKIMFVTVTYIANVIVTQLKI